MSRISTITGGTISGAAFTSTTSSNQSFKLDGGKMLFYNGSTLIAQIYNDSLGTLTFGTEAKYKLRIVSDYLTLNGYRMEWGSSTISYYAAATGSKAITFSTSFTSAPMVFVSQPFDSVNLAVKPSTVTTSGFTVSVPEVGSSGTMTFYWLAIGLQS